MLLADTSRAFLYTSVNASSSRIIFLFEVPATIFRNAQAFFFFFLLKRKIDQRQLWLSLPHTVKFMGIKTFVCMFHSQKHTRRM